MIRKDFVLAAVTAAAAFTSILGLASTAQSAAFCRPGYVWRDAADGDAVCVTPQERAIAKQQNANGPNNRQTGGGNYGPNTCRQGYVWREAFGGDVVCVTPYERTQAARQNADGPSHTQ